MADIVKKLNLNRTPQQVEPNSMIFAKNIKLDSTCSAIVRDDKLDLDYITKRVIDAEKFDDYKIAGVITASNEVCVFYADMSVPEKTVDIYRYNEKYDKINIIPTNIEYHNGRINGTFNYNVRNELILIFCESEGDVDVPMRTINCGVFDQENEGTRNLLYTESYYDLLPNVPIARVASLSLVYGINIPNGVYKFFIRYEINENENTYSDWFPIGKSLFAAKLTSERLIYYLPKNDINALTKYEAVVNNTDKDCDYGFELRLEFENIPKYVKRYQIGYILNHDNSQFARIYNTYKIENNIVVFNGQYIEATEITSILEKRMNLFNVGNIINYDSRVYISNYKEKNDNVEFREIANNIKVSLKREIFDYTDIKKSAFRNLTINVGMSNITTFDSSTGYIWKYKNDSFNYNSTTKRIDYETDDVQFSLRGILNELGFPVEESVYTNFVGGGQQQSSYSSYYEDEHNIDNCYVVVSVSNNSIYFLCDDTIAYQIYCGISTQQDNRLNAYRVEFDSVLYVDGTNQAIVSKQTLCPNEVYNFFIHFVRSDGSFTNGTQLINDCEIEDVYKKTLLEVGSRFNEIDSTIVDKFPTTRVFEIINCKDINDNSKFSYYENSNGNKLFRVDDDESYLYYPEVSNVTIPEGYVGYFLSYEKVEPLFNYTAIRSHVAELDLGLCSPTSSYFTINSDKYKGKYFDANNPDPIRYFTSNYFDETLGNSSKIVVSHDESSTYDDDGRADIINFYTINNSIYTKQVKTLYRLTDVFTKDIETIIEDYDLPCFYVKDVTAFQYTLPGIMFSEDGKVLEITGYNSLEEPNYSTEIGSFNFLHDYSDYKFSRYNLAYVSLKQKPTIQATVFEKDNNKTHVNQYIEPANLANTFELKSDYILSDKSTTTINDLVSVIAYDSLSSAKEQFDNTIRRSDVYADESIENTWRNFRPSEYKVISNIRGKIVKIVPFNRDIIVHFEHGFYLIDRDNRLRTRNTYAQLESPDIFELTALEIFPTEKGYLGLQDKDSSVLVNDNYICYDNDSKTIFSFGQKFNLLSTTIDKFLIQAPIVTCKCAYDVVRNRVIFCFKLKNDEVVTLSYNLLIGGFVSLHDYTFAYGYNTKQNIYLQTQNDKSLCIFIPNTKEPRDYKLRTETALKNMYSECKYMSNTYFPVIYNDNNEMPASIIDIMFNGQFEVSKVLTSITYVLSREYAMSRQLLQAEDEIDVEYPGEKIMIYSDRTQTEYIDVNDAANDNNLSTRKSYTKPWFDKGVWNFNYFKNVRANTSVKEDMSNIYGKYFVVRFVFDNTTLFKLSDLGFSYSIY